MEAHDYARILHRRWRTVLIIGLIVVIAVVGATLLLTPRYTATTRLFFAVQGSQSATDLAQGSTFAAKQMTSYAEVATEPLVLDPVIEELHLNIDAGVLAKSVTATVPTDTVILTVSVTQVDPEQATQIANAIGTNMTRVAASLSPEQQNGQQAVKATVLAHAVVPTSPSSPNLLRNLAIGVALGLVAGMAAAIARQLLDTRVRNSADVLALSDRPLLGSINFSEEVQKHQVMVADAPLGDAAESIRRLRTNLQFVGAGAGPKTLVITSSIPGEGKSTTAINLAVSLADAGSKVLLIDADLRRPSVADYLGIEGRAGLTTVLIGRAEVDDVIHVWRGTSLHVLASGQVPPNPSELLGSTAMADLLPRVAAKYDVVLFDSPPLLPVTDAAILARLVGGVLLVVGADRVHRRQVADALGALEVAGTEAHGIVINMLARRESGRYGYGYDGYGANRSTDELKAGAEQHGDGPEPTTAAHDQGAHSGDTPRNAPLDTPSEDQDWADRDWPPVRDRSKTPTTLPGERGR